MAFLVVVWWLWFGGVGVEERKEKIW